MRRRSPRPRFLIYYEYEDGPAPQRFRDLLLSIADVATLGSIVTAFVIMWDRW